MWSCVIRNDFGFGRIPATSAPVESDFNLVKNSFLKDVVRPIRIDEFLIKYLKLLDGKLKLTEVRIQELDKEDQNPQKQISDESGDESLDLCGLPIAMSSNGTKCAACMRKDNPPEGNECFICQKPIHYLDDCSISLSPEDGLGQQRICLSCYDLENLETILASKLEENWGGKTVNTRATVNGPTVKKITSVLKGTGTTKRATRVKELVVIESRQIKTFNSNIMKTPKTEKTTMTSANDNIDKKTAKYLGQKPTLIAEHISFQTWKPTKLTLLKNGSHETLAATKIDNTEVYAINTCAFDSFYQIITTAINDWDNFGITVNDNFYSTVFVNFFKY